jgi:hypothetical protein
MIKEIIIYHFLHHVVIHEVAIADIVVALLADLHSIVECLGLVAAINM